MTKSVTVVDYGMGNLLSVRRALEHCGARVTFATRGDDLEGAERVVLPGVGAFADGMRGLLENGFVEPIKHFAARGGPLLGICLGMQMLASVSEEFGEHEGLGLIPGRVVPIAASGTDGRPHKIPHIGWSALRAPRDAGSWAGTVLESVAEGSCVYLVHSYSVATREPRHRMAYCDYDGLQLTSAIQRDNIQGCQFHPEKSGEVGLKCLRRFLAS